MHVTIEEIRAAAYEVALRITPRAWDPTEVKQRADRIVKFFGWPLPRPDFELRRAAIDMQTTALGCHPHHLCGVERMPPQRVSRDVADWSDAEKLVANARKILDYLTRP